MRNRHKGKCNLCGVDVPAGDGRWRLIPKKTQDFTGLRCKRCGTTTKKNLKRLTALTT